MGGGGGALVRRRERGVSTRGGPRARAPSPRRALPPGAAREGGRGVGPRRAGPRARAPQGPLRARRRRRPSRTVGRPQAPRPRRPTPPRPPFRRLGRRARPSPSSWCPRRSGPKWRRSSSGSRGAGRACWGGGPLARPASSGTSSAAGRPTRPTSARPTTTRRAWLAAGGVVAVQPGTGGGGVVRARGGARAGLGPRRRLGRPCPRPHPAPPDTPRARRA